MNAYREIIFESGTYDSDVVNKIAMSQAQWESLSWVNKERLCCHITCCMLLANKETVTRKRKGAQPHKPKDARAKRPTGNEIWESKPGCSTWAPDAATTISMDTSVASKETISSTEEQLYEEAVNENQESNFRFELLRYSFNPQQALKSACEKHGLDVPYTMWDLIDNKEGKLVNVYIDISEKKLIGKFDAELFKTGDSCNAFYVLPGGINGQWRFKTTRAHGEVKIVTFLASRRELFHSKSLIVVPSSYEKDPLELISVSRYINECIQIWKTELVANDQEQISDNTLYNEAEKPTTLKPQVFLKGIVDTRVISTKRETIEWKGKIMPEGFSHNIKTEEWGDREMVLLIIQVLKEALETNDITVPVNENSSLKIEAITCLIETWEGSYQNTFDLLQGNRGANIKPLERALGIKMKGRTYKETDDTMKQEPTKELVRKNYPDWYEEVLTSMAEQSEHDIIYFPETLTTPPTDNHPIASICEEMCTQILEDIQSTKAAQWASKLSNLYSRLGGAYSGSKVKKAANNLQVAMMFPIVATGKMRDDNVEDEENKRVRLVSGIVVRGPPHARKPTDKIAFITIELLKVCEDSCDFARGFKRP